MVLGRREISAILLAVGALLFYVVLLSAQSVAQPIVVQNGGTTIVDNVVTTFDNNIQFPQNQIPIQPPIKKQPTNIVNVPKKKLPPSGGLPVYGVVASFILAGAGLLALGYGVRRGRRR